jgi:hypothetical protein
MLPGAENMSPEDQKKDHAYLSYNKKWYRYHGEQIQWNQWDSK